MVPTTPTPTFEHALERFLARVQFTERTRQSYAQDLAPLRRSLGDRPVTALTGEHAAASLVPFQQRAASTFNRRLAALRSFVRWCTEQGWLNNESVDRLERRPQPRGEPRALDPGAVEVVLRAIRDPRDRALFWLIYDGGLRCSEALAIDIEEINWGERAIRIHGKGNQLRELFFSRRVAQYLDTYLKARGEPSRGALFTTSRKARCPRRADLTADGYARLSYRQADTRWKRYTPGWDLHQLRHTAITVRAAHGYTEVELKRFSGHQSLRSLEGYIAANREATKRKAREWERANHTGLP